MMGFVSSTLFQSFLNTTSVDWYRYRPMEVLRYWRSVRICRNRAEQCSLVCLVER